MDMILFISIILILLIGVKCEEHNETKPNLLLFLTDDQDLLLSGWVGVPRAKQLIGNEGITFSNAFATTPICCPNRASILTGRYLHNHHTTNNTILGNCSSPSWQENFEPLTYASILKQRSGYRTFYAGKYLNTYGSKKAGGVEHIPLGWDWWNGLVGNSKYYNYTLSVNGTAEIHGEDPTTDYFTDVINRKANLFLQNWNRTDGPFLMVLSFPACHSPFTPHPRHAHNFTNLRAPRTPNFDSGARKDKHWLVRINPENLPTDVIDSVDETYRNRLRTLLAVDETVENILNILESKGQLEQTYVFFTSDHGYHLGQFSQPWDKRQPYDTDIRVPLMVRGPGIEKGQNRSEVVLTLDLAQTFIELGGIDDTISEMDGKSMVPLLRSNETIEDWRTKFLVEYRGEGNHNTIPGCPQFSGAGSLDCYNSNGFCACEDASNNTYNCLRFLDSTENTIFCSFDDSENFEEFYDLKADPWAMNNLVRRQGNESIGIYRDLLKELKSCKQNGCHSVININVLTNEV